MRFYEQDLAVRILLPLLTLTLFFLYIWPAFHHPTTDNRLSASCWGIVTVAHVLRYWGTFWKVTPQGLFESRSFFARRLIPYNIIQDVNPNLSKFRILDSRSIKITILLNAPIIARPDDYPAFVAALEQHLDPTLIHV